MAAAIRGNPLSNRSGGEHWLRYFKVRPGIRADRGKLAPAHRGHDSPAFSRPDCPTPSARCRALLSPLRAGLVSDSNQPGEQLRRRSSARLLSFQLRHPARRERRRHLFSTRKVLLLRECGVHPSPQSGDSRVPLLGPAGGGGFRFWRGGAGSCHLLLPAGCSYRSLPPPSPPRPVFFPSLFSSSSPLHSP